MMLPTARATFAVFVLTVAAGTARADVTLVDAFSAIPGAVFHDLWHPTPCGAHFHDPVHVDVGGGHIVTVTFFSELSADGSCQTGCTNWSQTAVSFHVPNDPSVDPGDLIGEFQSPSIYGDLIFNFSEPLTGFGSTAIIALSINSYDVDTFVLYDGPNGTGNVLAQVSSDPIAGVQVRRDFKGAFFPDPQIRSVRYLTTGQGILIDGFAIAAPAEPVDVPGGPVTGEVGGLSFSPATPNPFTGATHLTLTIPQPASLRVEVFAVDGRRVRTLADGGVAAGTVALAWDGRDARGALLPPGLYMVRASLASGAVTRRVLLAR